LFEMSYKDMHDWFMNIDPQIKEDDYGFISIKFGIGTYAPDKDEEPELPCESITAFKMGYYK
jgi:hypothetical protein